MHKKRPTYIIAIGASAGGLEEIVSFFDHTLLDGVSYIILQHLSSDFKSRMVELLSRHSMLAVKEAENAEKVKSNVVYLIPNNKYMTINDGKLYIEEKAKSQAPHLTINRFFTSLAASNGQNAIGIIFSGLGSDGTEGIKLIKEAGGMAMVRNPETTQFSSMPSHAIATGMIDFVLEPEFMPAAIEDHIKKEKVLSNKNVDNEKYLEIILNLIKESSPLDFLDYKPTTILRRIKKRAALKNVTSLAKYFDFLKTDPEEIKALTKEFLISVTSFFRDKEAFDVIAKKVIPLLLEALPPGEELKMWVAGCASGQEAYSMAITVCELLTGAFEDVVVKIFATDIDGDALAYASKGVYSLEATKNISSVQLDNYFLKEGGNYRIKPAVRKMVIFARHNLFKNPPYCNVHFISCRNLLIYIKPVLQKKIFARLLFGLKTDGYLFLGSSEAPTPVIESLEVVNKKWKVYKNLKSKQAVSFDAFTMPALMDINRVKHYSSREDVADISKNSLFEVMHQSLANEFDYLVLCIDENNTVLKSFGDTTKYLLHKHFNSNLQELLPKQLALAFNISSSTVLKTGVPVAVNDIVIKGDKTTLKVNLSVIPLSTKNGDPKLLMVTIKEDKFFDASGHSDFDEKQFHDQYTRNLEEQQKELNDKLRSAYEQLDALNENMQSFISANEEMQSTNEEMQSINEELDIINTDYQLKNKELLDINDDLNNYFRSNINGQLFINNELQLIKFSPGTVKLINLLDTDIGRPLSNISTNIKFETIIEDIKQVFAEGAIITKEIETNDGNWFQVMTMPYLRQADNKKNGAIITFNDITELKKAQAELNKKNNTLLVINDDLENFIHAASHDLLAPLGNIEGSLNIVNELEINNPEAKKFLGLINISVKKFQTLIKDIATIAKVESDMVAMEMVDLDEIIGNIEWSLENKIKTSGAVIIRDFNVKQIEFSKKNLRSILYNLISNGIKFKGELAPVIKINTVQSNDRVLLTVEDNGIGMDKRSMSKIFDIYGRINKNVEGQGIGLFLAKKIVNASGGNFTVESVAGKGSKFIIFFKVHTEQNAVLV
ncbi:MULTISPECIES: CheR family methyltransferase [unclassified Mucilaginibacter]|uniref:CheR family methyltransferase n=1 Tax=unclassified Mucilaginibacter TaxID=2617802 RepID=UPI002AC9C0D0|nr:MULTISPECIES: CheR family methyltransferase [unclassified Mucilaginibacter]MEB0261137.1 CheR family methyltransferase [Mucilaginibacter sp. 10I4]MEB0280512.1 CheR family methyltransferase [Mucilaginibacter sp. 10B2]MEB0301282.1 CheR family methyltransferase [Mucilaginibacter sp. 5C4]WPX22486.1 CheR family methyltransferase [Mucilaginibacter sp. 5C4]